MKADGRMGRPEDGKVGRVSDRKSEIRDQVSVDLVPFDLRSFHGGTKN
jgi:hypothetical protein